MMASSVSGSKASMLTRARWRARSSSPLWPCSEPQHCWSVGRTTSQPWACNTSIVSAFTSAKATSCTQPDSKATRWRGSVGWLFEREACSAAVERRLTLGVRGSSSRKDLGSRRRRPLDCTSHWSPDRWYSPNKRPRTCSLRRETKSHRSAKERMPCRRGDARTPTRSISARACSNRSA